MFIPVRYDPFLLLGNIQNFSIIENTPTSASQRGDSIDDGGHEEGLSVSQLTTRNLYFSQ